MAQYLKSLVTGVVLPYNEAALKSADIRKMSASECEEYEAKMRGTSAPAPVVEEPVVEEPVVEEPVVEEPAVGEVLVEDLDPDVEGVLGALETD